MTIEDVTSQTRLTKANRPIDTIEVSMAAMLGGLAKCAQEAESAAQGFAGPDVMLFVPLGDEAQVVEVESGRVTFTWIAVRKS